MLALTVGEVVMVLIFALLCWRSPAVQWRQWHHAYLGALLVLAGVLIASLVLAWVGIALTFDDVLLEHVPQAFGNTSPLRWAFTKAAKRWPVLAEIAKDLDGVFGARA